MGGKPAPSPRAQDSTEIGGLEGSFPSTSWSLVREASDAASERWQERMGTLLGRYWKPVYRYIRIRWRKPNEDAKDLTQDFFAFLLDREDLRRASPQHGTFRSYMKTALEHFLVDEHRKAGALKRGGGRERVAIDFTDLDPRVEDPLAGSPEEAFDHEWAASCLADGVRKLEEVLRAEGREVYFKAFERYYLDRSNSLCAGSPNPQEKVEPGEEVTYESVAADLGLQTHDVSNFLVYARRKLRSILKDRVSDYSASEHDATAELKFILGD